ncbi:hypothetical protein HanOQP8_Chr08g0286951 [Helianthus annuus]|nr:hypothetical protein HanHA89_Chr08g0297781 [Helianthus annuus]KAJ0719226.1 hypothetical protein HanLR1_Chr08g0279381 [Helianthus annuus]KAJ0722462.1 hypothetical protein HanOQP8_Chr08g0286951 [Helianthus annuus]
MISVSIVPVKFLFSRTSFDTLFFKHCLTPSHLQKSVPFHCKVFDGSMDCFKLKSASLSPLITHWKHKKNSESSKKMGVEFLMVKM